MSTLQDLEDEDANGNEGLLMELSGSAQTNAEIRQNLEEFAVRNKDDVVYWVEKPGRGDDVTLYGAPLHVGELLEELLYTRKSSVIMTSATLAANGTFDHIQERTGFVDSEQRLLGSPFDFPNSALVCVPNDMPEPSAPNYMDAAAQAIGDAAIAAGGRTMALFTSYASLREAAEALRGTMKAAGNRSPRSGKRRESRSDHSPISREPTVNNIGDGQLLGGHRPRGGLAAGARRHAAAVQCAHRAGVRGAVGAL